MNAREQGPAARPDIHQLTTIWLDWRRSGEQARRDAAALIANAGAVAASSLRPMSAACELLRDWVHDVDHPGLVARADAALARVRAAGFDRATRLAEVVWAQLHVYLPRRRADALALIQAHGDAAGDSRPAAERFWTEIALCKLYGASARYDEALAHGLQAEALARSADDDLLRGHGLDTLGGVFLCVGDAEAACPLLRKSLQTLERLGIRDPKVGHHLLLALLIGQHFEEAARCLDLHPWLCETAQLLSVPILRSVVARVRLANGHRDAAAALVAIEAPPHALETVLTRFDRTWVEGDILLMLGRPEEAGARVEACLESAQSDGSVLSVMSNTQLHRVLGEAWEVMGDAQKSLAALQVSQAAGFRWVGDSQQARGLAIKLGSAGTDAHLQARRQRLLDDIMARAHREALAEAAERHQRVVAQVMQEMRNPLDSVIGMSSRLLLTELDAQQHEYASQVRSSAQILMSLCNHLMGMTRIESGQFELLLQPADVGAMLNEVALLLGPVAESGAVELRLRVDPALPAQLDCDRLRLQQVVMSLLGNALEFTHAGSIDVSADWRPGSLADEPGELRVAVRDTGRGVTPEERVRLFQDISQAHAGIAHGHGGSGLGLALCRRLIEQMGGRIDMDSVPGQGSTIWFQLPLRPTQTDLP